MSNLSKYYNRPFPIKNVMNRQLKIGDKVIIHPTTKSISQKPYEATIIYTSINWSSGTERELCTHVEGGHMAVINDYLFSRMEYKLNEEEIINNRDRKIKEIIKNK